jgi:hypothetical protein
MNSPYVTTSMPHTEFGAKQFKDKAEEDEFYRIQRDAAQVLEMNRKYMPIPGEQESAGHYRRRIAETLADNTDDYRRQTFVGYPDSEFEPVERKVYAQAAANYLKPRNVPAGELVQIKRIDPSGREYYEYGAGQKGVSDPKRYPAGAVRKAFAQFLGPCYGDSICIDNEPQPIGKYPDQRIRG